MKHVLLILVFVALSVSGHSATVPFHGKSGRNLKDAVAAVCRVKSPVVDANSWMADCLADDRGMLLLPLEGKSVSVRPVWPDNLMALEIIPSAWWRFDSGYSALRGDTLSLDLVNLIPAVTDAVSLKSVYPPAELHRVKWTDGAWSTGFLTVDGVETNGWSPPEDMRGDVARVVFYMLTIYPSQLLDPWSFLISDGQIWPGLTPYAVELLMRWSREDPVNESEQRRNNLIASAQGGFGNPFVKWQGLEEYLWGDRVGEIWTDPDAPGDERVPLRSVYHLSDPDIYLWTPLVADDAVWSINGVPAAERVSPVRLGVGRHEFSFVDPRGNKGAVIITVMQ